MIVGNPLAWIGLAAIAVPILVHLLARHTSNAIPFPTLRFLRAASVTSVRRRRLADIPLLLVRCGIIALAVAALAQPFLSSSVATAPRRLVIVDSTPSVDRTQATREAGAIRAGDESVMVIERAHPDAALEEAAGWAAAENGPAIVTVISDFQRGAFDPGAIALLPAAAGLELRRVGRAALTGVPRGVETLSADGEATTAAWRADRESADDIQVLTAQPPEAARAIVEAGLNTSGPRAGAARPVTFVLSDAPGRERLARESAPATEPWMFDAIKAIDGSRAQAMKTHNARAVVFLATADPVIAADAIRQALPALSTGPAVRELEPVALSDQELRALERPSAAPVSLETPRLWLGRWLWGAALLLLWLEQVMRRERTAHEPEVAHAA